MPLALRKNRGLVIAGAGLMLLTVFLAMLNSRRGLDSEGKPSSYSNLRRGGKAAFLLLKQTGYDAERWERSPQELPKQPDGTTLIIAGPQIFPTQTERDAITRFVVNGGHLLLAGVFPRRFVPRSSSGWGDPRIGFAECKPVALTRLTRGGPISQDGFLFWDNRDDTQVAHFADAANQAVVISYNLGKGEVIWWASTVPLVNSGIQDRGNLDLLLNSIGSNRHVLWDEYYHGEHELAAMLEGSAAALEAAGAQAALLVIALLLTFSRRSGPTVSLAQESRLSPFEFVQTLGSVFHRAQSPQVAVEIANGRFRQIAARRLGLRGNATSQEIVPAMRQRGLTIPPEMEALLQSSEEAATDLDLSEKRAMEYVRSLNHASALLDPSARKTTQPGGVDAGN